MGNLLSGHKNPRATITDHDRAVLALKAQRKKLEDQTKLMEKRIDQHTIAARTLIVQKKQQQALLALKRKRLSENQLHNIQSYLMNVEDMLSNMELTKQQSGVMTALKQGNEALKKAQQEMPLDDIEKLMDDTAEAKQYQERVSDLLGQQLDESDNEAVLAELQQLEDAALQEELAAMPNVPAAEQQKQQAAEAAEAAAAAAAAATAAEEEELPSVPQAKVEEQQEQEQQRQLEEPLAAS